MKSLFLISNSPGEVSTFLRPVLRELKQRQPDWHYQVCLVPCPYASGAEAGFIRDWPEKPQVWSPWQTSKAWWNGDARGLDGAVVFLGGDPWHALLLKSRFEMPCLAYFPDPSSWVESRWLGGFDSVALGFEPQREYADPKVRFIRDLRVDAAEYLLQRHPSQSRGELTLALFPGSRWMHLKAVLGPFLRTAEMVKERVPNLRVILAASPFVSKARLQDAAERPLSLGLAKTTAELNDDHLYTSGGLKIEVLWGEPYRVINECDMALSLPGSNTAELSIAGKATVVPLSTRVPVGGGGLLGVLDRLPGFGFIKKALRLRKRDRLQYVAFPNMLVKREVIPEFIIQDDLSDLVDKVSELLLNDELRHRIGSDAKEAMGPAGASQIFVDQLEEMLAKSSPGH